MSVGPRGFVVFICACACVCAAVRVRLRLRTVLLSSSHAMADGAFDFGAAPRAAAAAPVDADGIRMCTYNVGALQEQNFLKEPEVFRKKLCQDLE